MRCFENFNAVYVHVHNSILLLSPFLRLSLLSLSFPNASVLYMYLYIPFCVAMCATHSEYTCMEEMIAHSHGAITKYSMHIHDIAIQCI